VADRREDGSGHGEVRAPAGHLRIIPGDVLEAGAKPLFTSATRKLAIDLGSAYMVHDNVTVQLPPNYSVQCVPKNASLHYLPYDAYRSAYKVAGNTYTYQSVEVAATTEYLVENYPNPKSYFEQVSQADKQPLVFKVGPVPAKASVGGL
jgi:hypothetical protein